MSRSTEPIRQEHQELLPHVDHLRDIADLIGSESPEAIRKALGDAYEFLARHLVPHAHAEDRVLYPAVARIMGAPQATATMSRDHVEVSKLTAELAVLRSKLTGAPLSRVIETDFRRVLYGLHALVKLHFAKEEDIYLPLLDAHLGADEARQLFIDMEAEADKARGGPSGHAGRH
jgi:iron-sulfur cluster repair protein YtfE (RIC family)